MEDETQLPDDLEEQLQPFEEKADQVLLGEGDAEGIFSYLQRLRIGREVIFHTLKQAITEYEFEIRVLSDSQFEVEFFGVDAPPILLITVDAPIPPQAF